MKRTASLLLAVLIALGVLFAVSRDCTSQEESKDMTASPNGPRQSAADASGPPHTNRLANETSPYLLQHAGNPVDWYPWGDEALARAKKEQKPIFLSIGYSACHWCHVMEHESFEDADTAKFLNEHFIAIKVDREERPDVDEIYMTAVQLMTGSGGWPLSVFLTPDLKPFYGGTYFPPEDRFGMPSFKKVLITIARVWKEQHDDVAHNAEQMVLALKANTALDTSSAGPLDRGVLDLAVSQLQGQFDPQWGGFGGAPKFPPTGAISLLLRQHLHSHEDALLKMATVTLDRMARGGMYDQLGGGFHRYSVDAHWLVPHFEKMLYDQALLSKAYLEAWQATGNESYRSVAAGILDYVLRDMTDSRGGFHSAEDADSEGVEGKFYVWQKDDVQTLLGDDDSATFCRYYGVTDQGNFEGENILNVVQDPQSFARDEGTTDDELDARLQKMRSKLLVERDKRIRPGKDDKVLAAWNGMMISALAKGYQATGDERYLAAARRAADFVLSDMVRDGMLLRTYRGTGSGDPGTARLPGYLDDYAEMSAALVDLYEADFDHHRLEAADRLVARMIADFWDPADGGFFYTSGAHKDLLVRTRPFHDAAVPSGNSTATAVLLRLARLLGKEEYQIKAQKLLKSLGNRASGQPTACLNLLCALDFQLSPAREIAVAGNLHGDDTRLLLDTVHGRYLPNTVLAAANPGTADFDAVGELIPLVRGKKMVSGKATAYVCQNYACKQPVTNAAELRRLLD